MGGTREAACVASGLLVLGGGGREKYGSVQIGQIGEKPRLTFPLQILDPDSRTSKFPGMVTSHMGDLGRRTTTD